MYISATYSIRLLHFVVFLFRFWIELGVNIVLWLKANLFKSLFKAFSHEVILNLRNALQTAYSGHPLRADYSQCLYRLVVVCSLASHLPSEMTVRF